MSSASSRTRVNRKATANILRRWRSTRFSNACSFPFLAARTSASSPAGALKEERAASGLSISSEELVSISFLLSVHWNFAGWCCARFVFGEQKAQKKHQRGSHGEQPVDVNVGEGLS